MDREGAGHLSKAEVASGFGTPVEMLEFAVISCNDSEKARSLELCSRRCIGTVVFPCYFALVVHIHAGL